MLDNNPPDDLLYYVKTTFDSFIDKSIYYFKAHDNNENLEKERSQIIHDDIDYEKEEREIEKGNYEEQHNEDDNEDDNDISSKTIITHEQVLVKSKYNKHSNSIGTDDIQKLPLDWFQNVRQHYKKNKIIPRKNETII